MKKTYGWEESAKDAITKISNCELISSIGIPCWPDEYIETLTDFTKLLFPINEIPEKTIQHLKTLDMQWMRFKYDLREYCSELLKEIDKIPNDE